MIFEFMDDRARKDAAAKIVVKMISIFKREYWELAKYLELLEPREGILIDGRSGKPATFKFSTDGEHLYYNVEHVLRLDSSMYKKKQFFFELMHVLHHCILGDPEYYNKSRAKRLFSAYADLRVRYFMYGLYGIKDNIRVSFAEYGMDNSFFWSFHRVRFNKLMCIKLRNIAANVKVDEHTFWEKTSNTQVWDRWRKAVLGEDGNGGSGNGGSENEEKSLRRRIKKLEEISRQIMGDRGGFNFGIRSCDRQENVKAVAENENSYTEVLRDFIKCRENEREDPDSIDTMFYTYGLDMYGDVALIEPAETGCVADISNLAIAIDTSGSCMGSLASVFLREVANLLRDICAGGRAKGELLMYQCDCDITKKEKLSDVSELMGEFETMTFHGCGGTSFVPVFNDIRDNEKQVRGLFYLTDGIGVYPDEKPEYPVYFIVPRKDLKYFTETCRRLPDWIRFLPIDIRKGGQYHVK